MGTTKQDRKVVFAGFWWRALALLIDVIILSLLIVGICMVLEDPLVETILAVAITFVYCVGFWVWRGQTLGKMLLGMKIIRVNRSRLTLPRAALRYLVFWAYLLTFPFLILYSIYTIVRWEGKQGVHDRIAGTCVLRIHQEKTEEA